MNCRRTRHTGDSPEACSRNCKPDDDKCFTMYTKLDSSTEGKFIHFNDRVTWQDADRACRNAGMQLATIRSEDEQKQAQHILLPYAIGIASKFIKPLKKADFLFMNIAWVGLSSESGESGFRWHDDSAPVDISGRDNYGWGRGQPNRNDEKRCAALIRGMWNDMKCDRKAGYLCEKVNVCDVVRCDVSESERNVILEGSVLGASVPSPSAVVVAPDTIISPDMSSINRESRAPPLDLLDPVSKETLQQKAAQMVEDKLKDIMEERLERWSKLLKI